MPGSDIPFVPHTQNPPRLPVAETGAGCFLYRHLGLAATGTESYLFSTHRIFLSRSIYNFRLYLPRTPVLNFPKKTNNPNPSPIGNKFGLFSFGPSGENRTHGLLNPIQARYQNCATPGYLFAFAAHSLISIPDFSRFVKRFFQISDTVFTFYCSVFCPQK